jgi:hypothetical protein
MPVACPIERQPTVSEGPQRPTRCRTVGEQTRVTLVSALVNEAAQGTFYTEASCLSARTRLWEASGETKVTDGERQQRDHQMPIKETLTVFCLVRPVLVCVLVQISTCSSKKRYSL